MVSDKSSPPNWTRTPPAMFDIVVGFYPESKPKDGTPAHRPCLVTRVYMDDETSTYACEVCFGTKHLKTMRRQDVDIIIQNSTDLSEIGLPMATRFDLDKENRVVLEWKPGNFEAWRGFTSPKIGALTLEYQKEYAWLMAKRSAVG